uniref:Immunoglobulin heavy variable 6-2 n=1 Tax=Erpetoichthys calabaricus TaxID=27687 RepID=A0A8C4RCM4_ERPCA
NGWVWVCPPRIASSVIFAKKPGETLSITCQTSGYSSSCCNIHWIRQAPGNGLEWLGRDDRIYVSHMKGRLTLTRDDTNIRSSLQLTNLKSEDTAMYYCVKDSQW